MTHSHGKMAVLSLAVAILMITCGPRLNSPDFKERQLAVDTVKDQALLAQIALTDVNNEVRRAAVEKLTDPALLARVAMNGRDSSVQLPAVVKLTDQRVLAQIAVESKDPQISKAAFEKLSDQEPLARVAMASDHPQIARAAFEKLTDPGLLAMVALNGRDSNVQLSAVKKVSDQEVLAQIIWKYSWTNNICQAALGNLTDQEAMAKIAVQHRSWEVRKAAVGKLTDLTVLAKIAKNEEYREVKEAARKRYYDTPVAQCNAKRDDLQRLLPGETIHIISKITADYEISKLRAKAKEVMSTVLASLGYKASPVDDTPNVIEFMVEFTPVAKRYYAIGNPVGTDIYTAARADGLLMIRKGDSCIGAKNIEYATSPPATIKPSDVTSPDRDSKYFDTVFILWLTNMVENLLKIIQPSQAQLGEMAKTGMSWTRAFGGVDNFIFSNLTDQKILADVAQKAEEGWVRRKALEKLSDERLIAQAATSDKDPFVRKLAVERLTDERLIAQVATSDKDPSVRKLAVERLTDHALLINIAHAGREKDKSVRSEVIYRLKEIIESCEKYAEGAVLQNQENLKIGCGFLGPGWSSDHEAHFNWCKSGNLNNTKGENTARQQALAQCKKDRSVK
jgi:hypothetical protein